MVCRARHSMACGGLSASLEAGISKFAYNADRVVGKFTGRLRIDVDMESEVSIILSTNELEIPIETSW